MIRRGPTPWPSGSRTAGPVSIEVRKVDGEVLDGRVTGGRRATRAGFVDSYRGVVFRAS